LGSGLERLEVVLIECVGIEAETTILSIGRAEEVEGRRVFLDAVHGVE